MSYYTGNIPPPEKSGMFPPGSYPPAAGSYLPAQSGLPPGAPQASYPASMAQQYPSIQTYPANSVYSSTQTGYPVSTLATPAGAYQTVGFPSMPSMSNPSYPSSQGYPSNASPGYPAAHMPTQSLYGSAPLGASNPMYQSPGYPGMSLPAGAGRGYATMPMYPSSNYQNPYPGPSPYGPPY